MIRNPDSHFPFAHLRCAYLNDHVAFLLTDRTSSPLHLTIDEEFRIGERDVNAERFIDDLGFVNTVTDFAARVRTPQSSATPHLEGPRGISNTFSINEESISISLNLRATVS
jgi:hypothetical protein